MAPVHDGPISSRHAPPSGEAIQVSRLRFSDVDQVAEATRHANVEMSVAGGQGYRGGLLALDAQGLSIQWGFHGLPMLARGQIGAGTILAQWKSQIPVRCNGQVTGKGLFFYPAGSELQVRTEGPCSWVSASVADLERHAVSLAPEVDLGGDSQVRYSLGTLASVCAVRSLLLDVRRAVVSGMDLLRNPEARRALAAELGAAMVRAAAGEKPQRYREHLAACSALVRRADEHLRSHEYQPVSVSELCAALGTGEARLRDAFHRVYAVSPATYLRVRRLHLVRRKLRTTRREDSTVSAAAASLGFFEFGRFAREYRAMFGELPSQTQRIEAGSLHPGARHGAKRSDVIPAPWAREAAHPNVALRPNAANLDNPLLRRASRRWTGRGYPLNSVVVVSGCSSRRCDTEARSHRAARPRGKP